MSFSSFLPAPEDKEESAHEFIERFTVNYDSNSFLLFQPANFKIVSTSIYISTNDFKQRIQKALNLLKEKAPKYYGLIYLYNKNIIASDDDPDVGAYANFDENSIEFNGNQLANVSDEWIASTIIHELMHFWQYEAAHKYFYKKNLATSQWEPEYQKREMNSFQHELAVMRLIGSDEAEIKALERQRGTHSQAPQYYTRS